MILSPMLANPLDIEDIPKRAAGYWCEPKLDGIRCVASWDGRMLSRSAKTQLQYKLPDIAKAVQDLNLPQGVWLDGELGYTQPSTHEWPILDFNKTTRVTGSGDGTARYKQMSDTDPIKFWVFDYVHEDKNDEQSVREWSLGTVFYQRPSDLLQRVPSLGTWDEATYNSYVEAGGEGVILKNPVAEYVQGKRPTRTWYKVKKFDSFDGKIVSYDGGQGKYIGLVGALVVRHPRGFDVRCSGMTDETRVHMTDQWKDYLNKMCEVKFFGNVGKGGGGIRHPQFLRMRPDLD